MLCAGRGRGLCTGRGRGEGTSSRDAPELCTAVSTSPAGDAAVEAVSGRMGPAGGNVGTLYFERLRMLCAGRDLCTRRESGGGTSSRDAPELSPPVSTSPAGDAAVEAVSGRMGPAGGNVGTLYFELLRMLCVRRDLCTGREGGEGTSSRDAPELCTAVSTSPAGDAAVEAVKIGRAPSSGNVGTLYFERLRMLCARRDLCTRR